MNSLEIYILVLIVLNVFVYFLTKKVGLSWRIAGVIFIFCSPFVMVITMNIIGRKVGDGIAGAAAGITFGGLLVINAVIFFIIGSILDKRKLNYNR